MSTSFRKISRVRTFLGSTKWYLSEDCLLAAKQTMYAVEYRRFYLRDLESVVIWPSRWWPLRLIIPGVVFAGLGAVIWQWSNSVIGGIFAGLALLWVAAELALGPTAKSRIRTTGATLDLPLAQRARRARKVIAKIDVAVKATRGMNEQAIAPANITAPTEPIAQERTQASASASAGSATQTHDS